MGTDKGLLKKNNLTWAEIARSKFAALQLPVVISVNSKQVGPYSGVFRQDEIIVDDESIRVKGPLLGLLSGHYRFPSEDLFVLACDMVDMEEKLLKELFASFRKGKEEATVFSVDERLQPLCGIYTAKGLSRVNYLLRKQQLERFSMMYVLDCLKTNCIPVQGSFIHCFNNYNSSKVQDQSTECLSPSATRKM